MSVEDSIFINLYQLRLPAKGVENVKRVMASPSSRAVNVYTSALSVGETVQCELVGENSQVS